MIKFSFPAPLFRLLTLAGMAALSLQPSRAGNPIVTSIYTADPSAHVWADGRLYLYPSRDIYPPRSADLMDHYHVFSTDNMVDWRDEGEILNSSQVPWGRKEGGFMWAPDAAYRNGTYYFYFPHPSDTNWNASWKIGVATSDKPARDFKSAASYIQGVGGFAMIDPDVFMDTDGQAYLYYGGASRCVGVKLKPDMTEIDGVEQPMTGLHDFHEATWVFKRNGLYYLSYSNNRPGANQMEYATSSNPLGPWTSRGIYFDATGSSTTHGCVLEYKGQWYQFYHNKALSGEDWLRSVCVDKLNFNSDGTIQTLVQTLSGPPAVGPRDGPNPRTIFYGLKEAVVGQGADIENDPLAPHGESVHNLHQTGAFVEWDKVAGGATGGRATLDFCYATTGSGEIHLDVNGTDYSCLNTIATGAWNNFSGHARLTVPLNPGDTNVIRITGNNSGCNLADLSVTPLP